MPSRPQTPVRLPPAGRDDVTIGIVTALPVEYHAMSSLLEHRETVQASGDPNTYNVGYLPSSDTSREHRVALVSLVQDNSRNAAATCTELLRSFQAIRCVIMVGVAGGIPAPRQPDRHVRLGDVVVATEGIVDLTHVRRVDGEEDERRRVEGVSVDLLRAVNAMRLREPEPAARSWSRPALGRSATYARPPEHTDQLLSAGSPVDHPPLEATGHRRGRPKVHYGLIGSGDMLLRDERRRDELAARHRLLAVEMEGSGVAVSARLRGVPWFMVRGISDYCDRAKHDRWRRYAAMMAAAYTRELLGQCRPFPAWPTAPRSGVLALLPGPERDDIVRELEAVPDLSPRELWHAAAGDLPPLPDAPLGTVVDVFDHLLELNSSDGLPPAVALLDEVALRAGEPHAKVLRRRADSLAARLQATQALQQRRAQRSDKEAPPPAEPCVVIQIVPDAIDSKRCLASYWIQCRSGPWRPEPGGEAAEAPMGGVESVVERFVQRAERTWRHSAEPVSLEFLLPTELLDLSVEWWCTDRDSVAPSPLCADYGVVLRNLDRMRAEHRHRMWSTRWQALWRNAGRISVLWGGTAEGDLGRWDARLRFRLDVAVVVLGSPPATPAGRRELELALRAGVPVVIWDRRGPLGPAAEAAVRRLLDGEPGQLPGRLRSLRMEAATAGPGEAAAHPGRHMAVLWDDPNRLIDSVGVPS